MMGSYNVIYLHVHSYENVMIITFISYDYMFNGVICTSGILVLSVWYVK